MKLKKEFILHETGSSAILVSVQKKAFPGMLRLNKTAAFIVSRLKAGATEEELIRAVLEKYDASPEEAAESCRLVVGNLRKIGALEEEPA